MLPQDGPRFGRIPVDPQVRIVELFPGGGVVFGPRAARRRYPSRSAESYSPSGRIPSGMGGVGEYRGLAFAATVSSAAPNRLIQSPSSKFVRVIPFPLSSPCSAIAARSASPAEDTGKRAQGTVTISTLTFPS